MKVSVSLPEDDVAYVDDYAVRTGAASRSSVLQHAIALLRMTEMEEAYAEAWREWDAGGDAPLRDAASADGLDDAPR